MKRNYRMEVYSIDTTDGKEWVAEYIDLPYCVGGGATEEEAVIEAKENLEVYLEYLESQGVDIPTPSDHLQLNDYSGRIVTRLPKTLHKEISEISKREGVSINSLLVSFLSKEIEKYKAEEGIEKSIEEYRKTTSQQLDRIVIKQKVDKNDIWSSGAKNGLVQWN